MNTPTGRSGILLLVLPLSLAVVIGGAAWLHSLSQQTSPVTPESESVDHDTGEAALLYPGERSLAVLPFMLRAGAGDDARRLVPALHEELARRLGTVENLELTAPASAAMFRNSALSAAYIARELGVNYLLEGIAEEKNGELRLGAQLINAADGSRAWSGSWSGPPSSTLLFALQAETAGAVAEHLGAELSAHGKSALGRVPTRNTAAHIAWIEARGALTASDYMQAELAARRAIELDPEFSEPRTSLALALAAAHGEDGPAGADIEAVIGEALRLDPANGRALAALGHIRQRFGRPEWNQAFQDSLELSPGDAYVMRLYGEALLAADRPEQAEAEFVRVAGLDPLTAASWFALGRARNRQNDFGGARDAFERLRKLYPGNPLGFAATGASLVSEGRLDQALYWLYRAFELAPGDVELGAWILRLHDSLQDLGAAQAWAAWLSARVTRQTFPLAMLARHDYLSGEFQSALQHANLALRLGLAERQGSHAVFMRIKRDEALFLTTPEQGIDVFKSHYPELFANPPEVDTGNLAAAVNLSMLLGQTGRDTEARELREAALAEYDRPFAITGPDRVPLLPLKAEILALQGDGQAALAELGRVIATGWKLDWAWATDLNSAFNGVRDSASFREIVEGLAAETAFQRSQVPARAPGGG